MFSTVRIRNDLYFAQVELIVRFKTDSFTVSSCRKRIAQSITQLRYTLRKSGSMLMMQKLRPLKMRQRLMSYTSSGFLQVLPRGLQRARHRRGLGPTKGRRAGYYDFNVYTPQKVIESS